MYKMHFPLVDIQIGLLRKSKLRSNTFDTEQKPRGLVIILYVKGLSESVSRVFKKHTVATAMRPYQTLRHILVHPKYKHEQENKCEIVYEIPCNGCYKFYVGETGRKFGTRRKIHKTDCEHNAKKCFHQIEQQLNTCKICVHETRSASVVGTSRHCPILGDSVVGPQHHVLTLFLGAPVASVDVMLQVRQQSMTNIEAT